MLKRIYIYGLVGFLTSGQVALNVNNFGYSSEVLAEQIINKKNEQANKGKTNQLLGIGKKIEVHQDPQDPYKVEITYKYEKKKNFTNIEKNIVIMHQKNNHIINGGNRIESQAAKIARALSGKLLIASN